jgi:hypothetical protein
LITAATGRQFCQIHPDIFQNAPRHEENSPAFSTLSHWHIDCDNRQFS